MPTQHKQREKKNTKIHKKKLQEMDTELNFIAVDFAPHTYTHTPTHSHTHIKYTNLVIVRFMYI